MQADDDKSYDDINVTPMVDLYLVLLLIFIIMTTASVQGVKVNLPQASNAPPPLDAKKSQSITITAEGQIRLGTIPVTLEELEARLNAVKLKTPEFPVLIRCDGAVPFQNVARVFDKLAQMGILQPGVVMTPPK